MLPDTYNLKMIGQLESAAGLSVLDDGNAVFALLGANIMEGEAEFVNKMPGDEFDIVAKATAAMNLFNRLYSHELKSPTTPQASGSSAT